jgi:hypothetical protein
VISAFRSWEGALKDGRREPREPRPEPKAASKRGR